MDRVDDNVDADLADLGQLCATQSEHSAACTDLLSGSSPTTGTHSHIH